MIEFLSAQPEKVIFSKKKSEEAPASPEQERLLSLKEYYESLQGELGEAFQKKNWPRVQELGFLIGELGEIAGGRRETSKTVVWWEKLQKERRSRKEKREFLLKQVSLLARERKDFYGTDRIEGANAVIAIAKELIANGFSGEAENVFKAALQQFSEGLSAGEYSRKTK